MLYVHWKLSNTIAHKFIQLGYLFFTDLCFLIECERVAKIQKLDSLFLHQWNIEK